VFKYFDRALLTTYTRRSPRVFVEGVGNDRADHAHSTGTAVPRAGVRWLPNIRKNEKSANFKVNILFHGGEIINSIGTFDNSVTILLLLYTFAVARRACLVACREAGP
jgi:hypothetical protein